MSVILESFYLDVTNTGQEKLSIQGGLRNRKVSLMRSFSTFIKVQTG
jgi:hypothetical protein